MFQTQAVLAYKRVRPSGFQDRIYVMYHATNHSNVQSILTNGFNLSTGGTLGAGVYVSEDINKTIPYGDVTLKLVVYVGKTIQISAENRAKMKTWHNEANSAWIPSSNRLSENCVRKSKQIRVIGIARGWDKLDAATRALTSNREGTTVPLDQVEMIGLNALKKEYGLP